MRCFIPYLHVLLFIFFISGGSYVSPRNTWQYDIETNALLALKHALGSNYRISQTWVGPHCFSGDTTWYGVQCKSNRVSGISLESLGLSATIDNPYILTNFTELTTLSLRDNSLSGALLELSNSKLITVDLSGNNFFGTIPNSLLHLDNLAYLDLSHNDLSGSIPPFNQSKLSEFNVSYNNLSGKIPDTRKLQSFGCAIYIGNPNLVCGNKTDQPRDDNNASSNRKSGLRVTVMICLAVLGPLLAWMIFALCRRRKGSTKMKSMEAMTDGNDIESKENTVSSVDEQAAKMVMLSGQGRFDLNDLLKSSAECLGKGSFAGSYKVLLDSGEVVVVKKMRDLRPLTRKEFDKHIRPLTYFNHPNLLPFLGYYYASKDKLLIFKFAPNGNLFDRIHGERGGRNRVPFKWRARLSVARDIAGAMALLHANSSADTMAGAPPHGNLKPSNVLLDESGAALVSDYGLVPLFPTSLASKRLMSFRSPEYSHGGKVSKKSDVWCYGLVLIELLTGKPLRDGEDVEVKMCSWVNRAVREEWTCEVFDTEIAAASGAMKGMSSLLEVALKCSHESPERRPEMAEVAAEVAAIKAAESDDEDDDASLDRSILEESL